MENIKRVIASDDIVFEKEAVTIKKGQIFIIEEVRERGIVLVEENGERYLMDLTSFENGFEIYVGE